jgi:hypothetical protein
MKHFLQIHVEMKVGKQKLQGFLPGLLLKHAPLVIVSTSGSLPKECCVPFYFTISLIILFPLIAYASLVLGKLTSCIKPTSF